MIHAFLLSLFLVPKTFIDLTQFQMEHYKDLSKLKADWCMVTVDLTPGLRGDVLNKAVRTLGCNRIMITDGGINPQQLLENPNWTGQPANIGKNLKILKDAKLPVDYYMLYTEFNRQDQNQTLLSNEDFRTAYKKVNKKILPLTRAFDPIGAIKLKETMQLSPDRYPGVYLEVAADVNYIKDVKACDTMRFAHNNKRFMVVMISGKTPSTDYANDVKLSCEYFKKTCPGVFAESVFGVAVYELDRKGINWIGGKNSVSEALKALKGCIHG